MFFVQISFSWHKTRPLNYKKFVIRKKISPDRITELSGKLLDNITFPLCNCLNCFAVLKSGNMGQKTWIRLSSTESVTLDSLDFITKTFTLESSSMRRTTCSSSLPHCLTLFLKIWSLFSKRKALVSSKLPCLRTPSVKWLSPWTSKETNAEPYSLADTSMNSHYNWLA